MSALESLLKVAPWTIPVVVLVALLSFLASRPLSRRTGDSRLLTFLLTTAFGVVLAATLTPRVNAGSPGRILILDLERLSFEQLMGLNETSLNVLLFVPLAFFAALIDSQHLRRLVLLGAWLSPLAVELLQATLPGLGRIGFVLSDVVANMLGVAIGMFSGIAVRTLARSRKAASA